MEFSVRGRETIDLSSVAVTCEWNKFSIRCIGVTVDEAPISAHDALNR